MEIVYSFSHQGNLTGDERDRIKILPKRDLPFGKTSSRGEESPLSRSLEFSLIPEGNNKERGIL
jgi:hypothetical protein